VDGADIADTLRLCDAKTTLVIVASKTFTTIETMTNARTARAWMSDHGGDPSQNFAAVSTALDKTDAFGIDASRVFGFADWVGGRYSMWGPIGLSVMLAIGAEDFGISARRPWPRICPFSSRWWGCGMPKAWATKPALCCPMTTD